MMKHGNMGKKMVRGITGILAAFVLIAALSFTAFAGSWENDGNGWWYLNDDGTYPADSWLFDGFNWYHFDDSGYMQTGWVWDGNSWYYMMPSGNMYTGWLLLGPAWYYLEPSGAMATGTVFIEGVSHQFDSSGRWEGLSGTGSVSSDCKAAYYQLLSGLTSDINMIRSSLDDQYSWMTNVIVGDMVGDSTPELFYFTAGDESGDFTSPWNQNFTYTHAVHGHLVTYDPSTGNITELLDPEFSLYFNDNGDVSGYFNNMWRTRLYTAGNNCIYKRTAENLSGTSMKWTEYSYIDPGNPMYESYSVTGMGSWPEITNPQIAGFIDGTLSGKMVMDYEGSTDYQSLSYEDALNYFY